MAATAQMSEMLMKVKPYCAMVFLQFGFAGMFIIVMIAMQQGMSHWVLVVYRHLLATLAIAPFAFVLERFAPIILKLDFLIFDVFEVICHIVNTLSSY